MDKQTVTKWFKGIKSSAVKHSPEILTAVGIVGMISTTVMAVKATPKAIRLIEEKKAEENKDELAAVETVKVAWKPYVPAVVTGVVSSACLIGANSIHSKRHAALMTAYQLSTTALSEYREKVVETIGEKKEKTIHDKIAKDKVEQNPSSQSQVIVTGKGKSLCFDPLSGRHFESDIDLMKKAMNDLNYRMTIGMEMSISLNEFYDAIGLPQIPLGDELGWRVDKGMIDIHFSAQIDDDKPCIVIEHQMPPEYNFNKLY